MSEHRYKTFKEYWKARKAYPVALNEALIGCRNPPFKPKFRDWEKGLYIDRFLIGFGLVGSVAGGIYLLVMTDNLVLALAYLLIGLGTAFMCAVCFLIGCLVRKWWQ